MGGGGDLDCQPRFALRWTIFAWLAQPWFTLPLAGVSFCGYVPRRRQFACPVKIKPRQIDPVLGAHANQLQLRLSGECAELPHSLGSMSVYERGAGDRLPVRVFGGRMRISVGVGLLLFVSFAWTSSAAASPQSAPSTYSAYTGTDPKPLPPPPVLGPANTAIADPTFGTQILRVTDENTKFGQSFISIDAGFFRAWNADSTAIKLTGPHGDGYWLEFDPSTFKVGDGSPQPAVHSLPFGARWEWSTIDPHIIYYLNGTQIARYNTVTGVSTNLAGPSTGDPVGYSPLWLAVTTGCVLRPVQASRILGQRSSVSIRPIHP